LQPMIYLVGRMFLGVLRGSPKKRSIRSIWDDPQIVFSIL
jgi:hypothetical protein